MISYFKRKLKVVQSNRQQLFESQYKVGVGDCVTRNFAAVLTDDLMPGAKDKVHANLTRCMPTLNTHHARSRTSIRRMASQVSTNTNSWNKKNVLEVKSLLSV